MSIVRHTPAAEGAAYYAEKVRALKVYYDDLVRPNWKLRYAQVTQLGAVVILTIFANWLDSQSRRTWFSKHFYAKNVNKL